MLLDSGKGKIGKRGSARLKWGVRMGAGGQTTLPTPFGYSWKQGPQRDEWARLKAPGS